MHAYALPVVDGAGNNNNISYSHSYTSENVKTITKYIYNQDNTIQSEIDTTITNDQRYALTPRTIFNSHYSRTDYKYDSSKTLIEKVWSRADYKTPYLKWTYEHIETRIR